MSLSSPSPPSSPLPIARSLSPGPPSPTLSTQNASPTNINTALPRRRKSAVVSSFPSVVISKSKRQSHPEGAPNIPLPDPTQLDYVAPAPSIPPPSIPSPQPPIQNHIISAPIVPVSYQHAIVAPIVRANAKRLSQILSQSPNKKPSDSEQQQQQEGNTVIPRPRSQSATAPLVPIFFHDAANPPPSDDQVQDFFVNAPTPPPRPASTPHIASPIISVTYHSTKEPPPTPTPTPTPIPTPTRQETNRLTPKKALPDPRLATVPIVQKSRPSRATIHQILADAFPRPRSVVVEPKVLLVPNNNKKPASLASVSKRRSRVDGDDENKDKTHTMFVAAKRGKEEAPTEEVAIQMPIPFETLDNLKKPKVLIAGGGLGGLTLAILLHKAGIPFKVFERAREVKPLGKGYKLINK